MFWKRRNNPEQTRQTSSKSKSYPPKRCTKLVQGLLVIDKQISIVQITLTIRKK